MPGMRGEEDEQPARRRAVDAFVRTGSCGERTVGWPYRVVLWRWR